MPIACFGEMRWDVRPTGRQPGGAALSVAVHLHQLGLPTQLISRVGHDALGRELVAFVEAQGLSSHHIQHSEPHLTGVAKAPAGPRSEAAPVLVHPLAWDYIQHTEALGTLADTAEAFVFGSLAARSLTTRETLYRLLQRAAFKVFDAGLCAPHYSRVLVTYLLRQADLVKLSPRELTELMTWFGASPHEETALGCLAERFQLQAVCVTSGAAGAVLWAGGQLYRCPGLGAAVLDPCGSGEAFLAALLKGWLAGRPPTATLAFACAAAARVAVRPGATPRISEAQVLAFVTAYS